MCFTRIVATARGSSRSLPWLIGVMAISGMAFLSLCFWRFGPIWAGSGGKIGWPIVQNLESETNGWQCKQIAFIIGAGKNAKDAPNSQQPLAGLVASVQRLLVSGLGL